MSGVPSAANWLVSPPPSPSLTPRRTAVVAAFILVRPREVEGLVAGDVPPELAVF